MSLDPGLDAGPASGEDGGSTDLPDGGDTAGDGGKIAKGPELEQARSALAREQNPEVSEAQRAELEIANTKTALALFQKVRTPDADLVFSPHSIMTAMTMAYAAGVPACALGCAIRARVHR